MRASILLVLAACGGSPSAASAPQTMTVHDAGAAKPIATTSASTAPSAGPVVSLEPRRNGPTLVARSAMKMEGTLDDKQIVEAANADRVGLQQCAVPVASSAHHAGSLNLQITVSANGAVTGDLQSPASDDAKKCLLDLAATWKVRGSGKAMVLLAVQH